MQVGYLRIRNLLHTSYVLAGAVSFFIILPVSLRQDGNKRSLTASARMASNKARLGAAERLMKDVYGKYGTLVVNSHPVCHRFPLWMSS
jgi:hypothetical protein